MKVFKFKYLNFIVSFYIQLSILRVEELFDHKWDLGSIRGLVASRPGGPPSEQIVKQTGLERLCTAEALADTISALALLSR